MRLILSVFFQSESVDSLYSFRILFILELVRKCTGNLSITTKMKCWKLCKMLILYIVNCVTIKLFVQRMPSYFALRDLFYLKKKSSFDVYLTLQTENLLRMKFDMEPFLFVQQISNFNQISSNCFARANKVPHFRLLLFLLRDVTYTAIIFNSSICCEFVIIECVFE